MMGRSLQENIADAILMESANTKERLIGSTPKRLISVSKFFNQRVPLSSTDGLSSIDARDKSTDLDKNGYSILEYLIKAEDAYAVDSWLSKTEADVNLLDETNNPPLSMAFYTGVHALGSKSYDLIETLLRHGANPNGDFYPPTNSRPSKRTNAMLMLASNYYFDSDTIGPKVASLLIQYGANVNCIDSENKTVLQHAARREEYEICKVLLESGAETNPEGRTIMSDNPKINELITTYKNRNKVNLLVEDTNTPTPKRRRGSL